MGFRRRHGDGSCVNRAIHRQSVIFDIISQWKAIIVSILPCVSFVWISVTKLWDTMIHLCMCKGRTHPVKVLEPELSCKTANNLDFCLPITVKWGNKHYISDEIYEQNLCEWWHISPRRSSQLTIRIGLYDNRHAAFIHASNCITLRTDLVHMVQIFEIAYGTSCESRRWSWMRKGEEVELYQSKTSEMIYMP